jgi:hypothetical protein
MKREKWAHIEPAKVNQIVQEVYKRRYELAVEHNFLSLCGKFDINEAMLKKELRRQFGFDYTQFRRTLLGCGVFFIHKKLGKTQAETAAVLNIHIDSVKKICRETR